MKRLVAFFILIITVGLISHGIPAPRFVWESHLTELQTRLPEYDIQIDKVVLGLSHKPVVMVSGIQIKNKSNADRLDVGLLRVELDQFASWRRDEWVVSDLKLKGLRSIKSTEQDCKDLPIRCWHSMPIRVLTQISQMLGNGDRDGLRKAHKLHIQNMEWVQVEFQNQITHPLASGFGLSVEELKYKSPVQSGVMSDENGTGAISAGIKIFESSEAPAPPATPQQGNQLYFSVKAKQPLLNNAISSGSASNQAWKFDEVESEYTGHWFNSYPWSGSIAVGSLILRRDENAPFLKLQASELRTYISRLDSPADHQAAFSARQVEGGLPAQNFHFKQAEWTYTHEDAEAWTFDMLFKQASDSSQTTVEITPAKIAGSEAIPALAQTRVLGCEQSKSYWFWQDGWFRQQSGPPDAKANKTVGWVWCQK